eukprot:2668690-Rhodomonas_salina.1
MRYRGEVKVSAVIGPTSKSSYHASSLYQNDQKTPAPVLPELEVVEAHKAVGCGRYEKVVENLHDRDRIPIVQPKQLHCTPVGRPRLVAA